jgi:hypothetical protein
MPRFASLPGSRFAARASHVAVVTALVLCIVPASLFAWGELGHRITGEVAARRLPGAMPAFFRGASRQLAYLNPEPDRWRERAERNRDPALDAGAAPEHFINLEVIPPARLTAALAAPNRFAYLDSVAVTGAKGSAMGLLPFRIIELTQRLRQDFREWRAATDPETRAFIQARIIDDAGILGHYVADCSNPAHTSIQYNGWVGDNPNGYATDKRFHSRFESAYVDAHISVNDILSQVDSTPQAFPDVRAAVIAYLRQSNGLVERMYSLDKASAFDSGTSTAANKAFVVERLSAGARMLRDLWWTAWVTSA